MTNERAIEYCIEMIKSVQIQLALTVILEGKTHRERNVECRNLVKRLETITGALRDISLGNPTVDNIPF